MLAQRAAPRGAYDRPEQHESSLFEGCDRTECSCAANCHAGRQTCRRKQSSNRRGSTQVWAHPRKRKSFEASQVLACGGSAPPMIGCGLTEVCTHDPESCHASGKVTPAKAPPTLGLREEVFR